MNEIQTAVQNYACVMGIPLEEAEKQVAAMINRMGMIEGAKQQAKVGMTNAVNGAWSFAKLLVK